jgi:REP element-mobilizing transposase RayT
MAREARDCSAHIYHTMVRGNGDDKIFLDAVDKQKIIDILKEKIEDDSCVVFAYCISDDHAHFLIEEKELPISEIMKRINISYAAYYNRKHRRRGHVFYDRYLSEAIEDEENFMRVLRYIITHDNENSRIKQAKDIYEEYYDYIRQCLYYQNLTYEVFKAYIEQECEDCFMDLNKVDQEMLKAKELAEEYLKDRALSRQCLKERRQAPVRRNVVLLLKNNTNLSIRKIAEILQLNRGVVYKIISEENQEF